MKQTILLELSAGSMKLTNQIGAGWGGFAEEALAAHPVRYAGLSLSPSQTEWANARLARLDTVLFHKALGSYGDKAKRIETLARWIASTVSRVRPIAASSATRPCHWPATPASMIVTGRRVPPGPWPPTSLPP